MAGTRVLPWILLTLFAFVKPESRVKHTIRPLFSLKPVALFWDAPTAACETNHKVTLPLTLFDVSSTVPNTQQSIKVFGYKELGKYPYYDKKGDAINNGLPQLVDITEHSKQMDHDLEKFIPEIRTKGLSAIDWRKWDLLWDRNSDDKNIYRLKSVELVEKIAKPKLEMVYKDEGLRRGAREFEWAAKKLFTETLKQGKLLRRNQLWGFYMRPNCYNDEYKKNLAEYTGLCSEWEMIRNDKLEWLWEQSAALFPSIALDPLLANTTYALMFARNQIKEAIRHSIPRARDESARPVYVFTRPTYTANTTVLTQSDLIATIGESVALGAAGLVFDGDSSYVSNVTCSALKAQLDGPLGKYLLNVTTAAEECSKLLCKHRGRCLRKNQDSNVYLHINSSTHTIEVSNNRLKVSGSLGDEEKRFFKEHFQCQCYNEPGDLTCDKVVVVKVVKEKVVPKSRGASSVAVTWSQVISLLLGLLCLLP